MSETQILGLRNEDSSGAAGVSMSRETAAEPVTSLHEVWRKELSSAVSLQRLWWRWRGGGLLLWEKARQWEQEGVSSEPTGLCFRLYVCVCQSGEYKQRKEMIYSVYLHCESRRRCRERGGGDVGTKVLKNQNCLKVPPQTNACRVRTWPLCRHRPSIRRH